ncbi:MAG: DNA-binding transcriptional regulator [Planctomycetia bacterium]|nr:DNA-binding transcriptional regulator [Planctomycetia bacterium]
MKSLRPSISVFMRINHESMRGILRGILLYEKVNGPWDVRLELENQYWENDCALPSIPIASNPFPDGIIAWGNNATTAKKLRRAIRKKIPVVLINPWEEYDELPEFHRCVRIACDSFTVGQSAAEFFLEKNFRNFAYVGARTNVIWSRKRGEGFCQTLTDRGYVPIVYESLEKSTQPPPPEKSSQSQPSKKADEIRLRKWLQNLPPRTAIFAALDMRGKQIIDCCSSLGIPVPDAISVLSVDNDEFLCQMTTPSMSSIRLHLERAGWHAAEMLHTQMKGQKTEEKTYYYGVCRIESRGSTEIVVADNPMVVEAVAYIRNHCSQMITVADVARQFPISRRTLEKNFRDEMGHTLFQELLRQRLRKLARLLSETDIPLTELAPLCGFANDSYMGKVFRKYYGHTLLEHRRKAKA